MTTSARAATTEAQTPVRGALEPAAFAEKFRELCERAGVRTDRRGERVYCLDVARIA